MQNSQSQSPVSFKSSIDALSSLISRYQVSSNDKTLSLPTNSTITSQQITNSTSAKTNTNGLPTSTVADQYGLVNLLQMIQQAEKNPDSSMLLNFDLTTLGLSTFTYSKLFSLNSCLIDFEKN